MFCTLPLILLFYGTRASGFRVNGADIYYSIKRTVADLENGGDSQEIRHFYNSGLLQMSRLEQRFVEYNNFYEIGNLIAFIDSEVSISNYDIETSSDETVIRKATGIVERLSRSSEAILDQQEDLNHLLYKTVDYNKARFLRFDENVRIANTKPENKQLSIVRRILTEYKESLIKEQEFYEEAKKLKNMIEETQDYIFSLPSRQEPSENENEPEQMVNDEPPTGIPPEEEMAADQPINEEIEHQENVYTVESPVPENQNTPFIYNSSLTDPQVLPQTENWNTPGSLGLQNPPIWEYPDLGQDFDAYLNYASVSQDFQLDTVLLHQDFLSDLDEIIENEMKPKNPQINFPKKGNRNQNESKNRKNRIKRKIKQHQELEQSILALKISLERLKKDAMIDDGDKEPSNDKHRRVLRDNVILGSWQTLE